jgi:hypothetical protein
VTHADRTSAIFLASLAAFHAAAYALPGRAYFHLTLLSDSSAPVGLNVLLHPAFVLCSAYLAYRTLQQQTSAPLRLDALTIGLGLWAAAATLSAVANFETDQVVLTYLTVFVAGAAVYATISRIDVSDRLVDAVFLSLAAGALFPLVGGIRAYVGEWGIPDLNILLTATLDLARMEPYEAATFGNRGNTAAFLMIVAPPLVWLALDRTRRPRLRLLYAAALVPVCLNLLIIEVRAAFIALLLTGALIWRFRTGSRAAYLVFFIASALAVTTLARHIPQVGEVIADRFGPVVKMERTRDQSLMERSESIQEGLRVAADNWLLGIGPGGAITLHSQTSAHQFQIQQGMETGILGFAGASLATLAVLRALFMVLAGGARDERNRQRFALIIGPAAFLIYGTMANLTLTVGYVNTWAVLVAALLALFRSARRPAVSLGCSPRLKEAA